VRNAIRAAGAHLLFLPPYSPDLDPIERVTRFNTSCSRLVSSCMKTGAHGIIRRAKAAAQTKPSVPPERDTSIRLRHLAADAGAISSLHLNGNYLCRKSEVGL
jgi:hypothetical protein